MDLWIGRKANLLPRKGPPVWIWDFDSGDLRDCVNGPAISPIQGIPRGILSDRHSWSIIPGKPMPTIMRSRGQDKPVAGSVGATRTVNRTPPRRVLAAIQPRSAMVTSFSRREASLQSADTAKSMAANREGLSASVAVTVVDTCFTAGWQIAQGPADLDSRVPLVGPLGSITSKSTSLHSVAAGRAGIQKERPAKAGSLSRCGPPWLI